MSLNYEMREFFCSRCDSINYVQLNSRNVRCPQCSMQLRNFPFNTEPISQARSRSPRRSERNLVSEEAPSPANRINLAPLPGLSAPRPSRPEAHSVLFQEQARHDVESVSVGSGNEAQRTYRDREELVRQLLNYSRIDTLASRFNANLERIINRRVIPWFDIDESIQTELITAFLSQGGSRIMDVPRRAKATKKELLKRITNTRLNKAQLDNICTICLSGYKSNHRASELPCKHLFHKNCIGPWLKQADSCPVCRQPIIQ